MPTKTRIIIVSMLILLGGALFSFCLFIHPTEITAQAQDNSTVIAESESATVEAASAETKEQDKSEQNNQSRSESRPRPRSGAI
ncbi:MAG: hypothetical protein JW715_12050 [Sedimentisphaerales bacterium]|nr:hypothetical protein [Sedimentisphaerales bacterium]